MTYNNEDLEKYAEQLSSRGTQNPLDMDTEEDLIDSNPIKRHYKNRSYNVKPTLDEISLSIERGEFIVAGEVEKFDHKLSPFKSVRNRKLYPNGNGWNYSSEPDRGLRFE